MAPGSRRLSGRDLLDFVHPDYREAARETIATASGKMTLLATQKFVRIDGFPMDVEVTSFPFKYKGRDGVMVVAQDVTQRKEAEEALKNRERELEDKSLNLEEANAALRVLFRHRDEDKKHLENRILSNIKGLVFPYIERLRSRSLTDAQATYLGIVESNLNEVISPFLQKMNSVYARFTPMEIQVADLIKISTRYHTAPVAARRASGRHESAGTCRDGEAPQIRQPRPHHDRHRPRHDSLFELVERVTVLQEGRVLAEGTPAEIKKDPAVPEAYLGGVHDA